MALVKKNQTEVAVKDEIFDTRRVVQTLEGLMTRVTDTDISADTVNAACNCADKIVDILRLHLDVERLRRKTGAKEG
jgi:hypothetical protein